MKATANMVLRTIRIERNAFGWLDVNDRASGDALILVAITRLLVLIGMQWTLLGVLAPVSTIEVVVAAAINAAIFWLAYSGITYAIVKYLLQADGSYTTILRVAGFAYPTTLLLVLTSRLGLPPFLALALGLSWFLFIVAHGVKYESEMPIERCALAAVGGLVGWIVIALLLGRGLF